MPLELEFSITNNDQEFEIILANVRINHEYKLSVDDNTQLQKNQVQAGGWGISSGRFEYSVEDETTNVSLMAAKKEKLIKAKDALLNEQIDVIDLGIYSNQDRNKDFELTYKKEKIKAQSTRYFKFMFLLDKEVIKKYTNIKLDESGQIDEFDYAFEETQLTDEYDISLSIEDVADLRLAIYIMIDSATSNGRLRYKRYYNYK